jgi:uncharacterized protein (TIGR02231 family)
MLCLVLTLLTAQVDSRVDSVVVYQKQVVVVRSAQVTVDGSGELVFKDLPGGLDDNSVRIKAPGLRIGEVQIKKGYVDVPTPGVDRLRERVESLEREKRELANESDVLGAREEFLKGVKLGAPELIAKDLQQGRVASEAWGAALSFMSGELTKVKARQLDLEFEKRELEEELAAASKEYAEARAKVENKKELRFDYDASPGTYQVKFAYAVPGGAAWLPHYELRALPSEGRVDVAYYARLEQRTGEDWKRVRVVLSTTTPMIQGGAPRAEVWALTLKELPPKQPPSPKPELVNVQSTYSQRVITDEEFKRLPVSQLSEMVGMQAGVSETGISLQYTIAGRLDLKSGEPAKKFALDETGVAATFKYYTLPRVRQQAYLQGKLVNTGDFILLGGSASTYVGDEYTGTTVMNAVAPGESTEVSFGIDDRVKAKRELVRRFKTQTGFLSKSERIEFVFRTTVENLHAKSIPIDILEQIPVSRQREIKVGVAKLEPRGYELDADKGVYTWDLELEAKQKFVVDLEFNVDYPIGRQVLGLD